MSIQKAFYLSLVFLLSACTTPQLAYKIDPEIKNIEQLAPQSALIAVSVIDERSTISEANDKKSKVIAGPKNEADIIKTKLIENLKKSNFRIISNPLLADVSLEIRIKQFNIKIEDSFLQSNIVGNSHLLLKIKKQEQNLEKLYKSSHSQKVANPVSNLDLTGVVNHLLSGQLSAMMSDPALQNSAN